MVGRDAADHVVAAAVDDHVWGNVAAVVCIWCEIVHHVAVVVAAADGGGECGVHGYGSGYCDRQWTKNVAEMTMAEVLYLLHLCRCCCCYCCSP